MRERTDVDVPLRIQVAYLSMKSLYFESSTASPVHLLSGRVAD